MHFERYVSGVWAGNAWTKTECAYASVPHCFLTMSEFLKLFKILQTVGYYGFKTLVNIFEKVDPCTFADSEIKFISCVSRSAQELNLKQKFYIKNSSTSSQK